ncbi:MAG: hypothetical protein KGM17_12060 [Sphingomonadales bacterium]|nr:hypothetical protein [Sphingomonadales bacterium]
MSSFAALSVPSTGFARDGRFIARGPETMGGGIAPPEPPMPIEAEPDPLDAALARGFAEGMAAARAEAEAAARLADEARERFAFAFARLDAELTEALRQRLLDTVVALCEATLQPLALDKKALAGRVRKVADMFVRADDERVFRLHPDDLALVRSLLPEDWAFDPDPTLTRGTIRVDTQAGGAEDGPETWRRAIAEALNLC